MSFDTWQSQMVPWQILENVCVVEQQLFRISAVVCALAWASLSLWFVLSCSCFKISAVICAMAMVELTIRAACVNLSYRAAGSSIQAMFSWVHCVGGSWDGF